MKKLSLLKDWTKIMFILCMLAVLLTPGIIILTIVFPHLVPEGVNFTWGVEINFAGIIITMIIFSGYCCFVYSLYLFRKVLSFFWKKKFFDDEVVKLLDRVGKLIYLGLFLTVVPINVYYLATQKGFHFDFIEFWRIVFILSLGLFFTVLSEVFQMAKNLQEENDLTV